MRFSPAAERKLRRAGWLPGRDVHALVDSLSGHDLVPHARAVLNEFQGLTIGKSGRGVSMATSQVEIDLRLGQGYEPTLARLQAALGRRVQVIGELDGGHAGLAVDDVGCTYVVTDELVRVGRSFDEALEALLLGLKRCDDGTSVPRRD